MPISLQEKSDNPIKNKWAEDSNTSFIKEKLPTSGGKRLTEGKQSHLDKSNDSVSNKKIFLYFQSSVGLIYITFTFSCNLQIFIKGPLKY